MTREGLMRYRRASNALWRDTGRRVVVLPSRPSGDVQLLEGGHALVWRALDTPGSALELRDRLAGIDGGAPPSGEVSRCLSILTDRGIVSAGAP